MPRPWKDLSPGTRTVIVAAAVAEAGLKAAVLADLRRRPATEIRGTTSAWALSMIVNSAGLIPLGTSRSGGGGLLPPPPSQA